jgi:hypothetical protein
MEYAKNRADTKIDVSHADFVDITLALTLTDISILLDDIQNGMISMF